MCECRGKAQGNVIGDVTGLITGAHLTAMMREEAAKAHRWGMQRKAVEDMMYWLFETLEDDVNVILYWR
jgi:hypothetical protein